MSDYSRYAVFHVPTDPALSRFGAAWLGWDNVACVATKIDNPAQEAATKNARRYGLHGTLKPPFRLGAEADVQDLRRAVSTLASNAAPVEIDVLGLARLGRFLALVPRGRTVELDALGARCVRELDMFRAPLSQEERARRNPARLDPRKRELLERWGYPHVMDQFRFHMTLTGRLPDAALREMEAHLIEGLPDLPRPYRIDRIALMGEDTLGRFHVLESHSLRG